MPAGTLTRIAAGSIEACIDSMGTQLMSLKLDGVEYLWQGDPRWWPRRAPVLFPIVGSLRPGTTSAAGPCPMGRHGIARTCEHRLVKRSEASATYELASSEETLASYPYPFVLRMTYAITGPATLEQRFEVTNTGAIPLPYTVGGHPAFNVPIDPAGSPDEAFEDYRIEFTSPWSACSPTMVEGGLWDFGSPWPVVEDSDALPLARSLFEHDTVMLSDVPGSTATLRGAKSGHGVRLDFAGFPYLGIWSAAGEAPFVAVEPWTGCSTALDEDNLLEHKRGMRLLGPGETATHAFSMTLL